MKTKKNKPAQTQRTILHNASIYTICLFIFALATPSSTSVAKKQNQSLDPTDLLSSYEIQNPNEPKHFAPIMKINAARKEPHQSVFKDAVPINFEVRIEQNQLNQKKQHYAKK